jgi:hypothetical protein
MLNLDTLFEIYSFLEKDKPFIFLLSTNTAYNGLKSKFRYNKTTPICDAEKWNANTISYFPKISWRLFAENIKQIREASKNSNALQINYNRIVKPNTIPPHITKVYFSHKYDRPLSKGVIPDSVVYLEFGEQYTWSLAGYIWPSSLKVLVLKGKSTVTLTGVVLPETLEKLVLGDNFVFLFNDYQIPKSLKVLKYRKKYNRGLSINVVNHLFNQDTLKFPLHDTNIKKLVFGEAYNQPLFSGCLPKYLTYLKFGDNFNQEIGKNELPETLEHLELGEQYNQKVYLNFIPKSVKKVVVRNALMYEYFHQFDLEFECVYKL